VRDVCTVPPFLEMGAGGPTVVHDALEDLAAANLVDIDYSDDYPLVQSLAELDRQNARAAGRLPSKSMKSSAAQQLAVLDEALDFMEADGCLRRRLGDVFCARDDLDAAVESCRCGMCEPATIGADFA